MDASEREQWQNSRCVYARGEPDRRSRVACRISSQTRGEAAVDAFPTPPYGFNSWQAFRCNLSENDMLAIGRALVAAGLSQWYTFVNMDDCFARARLANGSLTGAVFYYGEPGLSVTHYPSPSTLSEDERRFPSTMFHLGAELRALGLGFGVYTSQVCAHSRPR